MQDCVPSRRASLNTGKRNTGHQQNIGALENVAQQTRKTVN